MLAAGWGVTYTSAGAEYGNKGADIYHKTEEKARNARRGMWASKVAVESPTDYKKRIAAGKSK